MKQLKIWDMVLNPGTRSHFITLCYVGGLKAGVTSNIILSMPPSDNTEDQVSLCFRSIVWNAPGLMKIIFGFLQVRKWQMEKCPKGGDVHQCDSYLTLYIWVTEIRVLHVNSYPSLKKALKWKCIVTANLKVKLGIFWRDLLIYFTYHLKMWTCLK